MNINAILQQSSNFEHLAKHRRKWTNILNEMTKKIRGYLYFFFQFD